MLDADWFGETEIVIFLIENGASINYADANGLGVLEYAKMVKEEFCDDSLINFLRKQRYRGMQICPKGMHFLDRGMQNFIAYGMQCINIGNRTHYQKLV